MNRDLRKMNDAYSDAVEMVEILESPHEIQDVSNARQLRISKGAISFNNVSFHFHDEKAVFNNFSLHVGEGKKIALVGPSGAGKSTVTKLILRLFDVKSGSIEIDGQNIASVTQDSLRNAIAFVPQEPILFHRTLMENIRYGRRDATDAEVIEAAKKANCHDFITALPQGYDTYVGERGVKLSGGERQRVAIARAILKDAPILILDEATSSLDSESEVLIQDALSKLMSGKTVLVIAHRLSTIMKMDRIVALDGGAIVEQGTHQELLHKRGLYAGLWQHQAGGFIQDEA
jgi:ATP-binding cassette, subfamily B, bacterial